MKDKDLLEFLRIKRVNIGLLEWAATLYDYNNWVAYSQAINQQQFDALKKWLGI